MQQLKLLLFTKTSIGRDRPLPIFIIFVMHDLQNERHTYMKEIISKRLRLLRDEMRREGLHAFIFPSTDPHNGEYTPARWKGREWISGFNGSAGTAVVTLNEAALWTDSRYFLAAEEQLEGTEFKLMKERMPETPSITKWIGMKLAREDSPRAGIDGMVCVASVVEDLAAGLRQEGGITLRTNYDPLSKIWKERPPVPACRVSLHPDKYSGEGCRSKIARIREWLKRRHICGMLVAALDDIAWTLNMRGEDVHCNPVFVSYLLITSDKATLFIDKIKLTPAATDYLRHEGVDIDGYDNITRALAKYGEYNILLDPNEINYTLFKAVRCRETMRMKSPVAAMKAIKNATEIAGFRNAMTRDGVAMVKFLRWLKPAVTAGGQTELSVSDKLERLRAEQDLYRGLSFDTISAYQEHGAIVHYEPTKDTDKPLKAEGLLLIDSGAQYLDGTTDITRTIALGPVTDEQRRVYTLVLKGHLQLQACKFPEGAAGTQIDAIARTAMWREGMNYMHGTGHGVGSYLNVHEGPHQIRMEWKPAALLPGMTVTDEPGLYLAGRFGVRTENTLLVVPYKETEFGRFVGFEPLTLCPIDTTPIIVEMMTNEEIAALDSYHDTVRQRLSPFLDEEERLWLCKATRPLRSQ